MQRRGRPAFATVITAVLLIAAMPSAAADGKAPITGKLSKRGYTVIALDASGRAKSVVAKRGRFKLRPPNRRVTLHLRARDGTYAGPIVVRGVLGRKGRTKKRVIVGVKAGAHLGRVKVRSAEGFAMAKRVAKEFLDTKRIASARNGVPIGAGNFGRVFVSKQTGPSSDRDRDGVPTSLDVDDDGDLILDDVDTSTAGAASATTSQQGNFSFNAFTALFLGATRPPGTTIVNANAPGLSDEQIESGLRAQGSLHIGIPPFTTGELDCGALIYCSAGGTGGRDPGQNPGFLDPNPQPFPACCDPDGDGFGSLDPPFDPGGGPGILLRTGAGADQIRTGDLLIARAASGAAEQQELTATLKTVFVTVPAIVSYADELGTKHVLAYPVTPGTAVTPGTVLPVVDGPDAGSDVSATLTFWRPQRRSIPDEVPPGAAGNWIDIGGLLHFAHTLGAQTTTYCPQGSYSGVEQSLVPSQYPGFPGMPIASVFLFIDSTRDQLANPSNTFSYTLNLSECQAFRGGTFDPGQTMSFGFSAALPPEPGQPVNLTESIYSFQHQP